MALFGLFGKKELQPPDWAAIAGRISGLLWTLLNTDPKRLASPYARIVLRNDWSVFLVADKRDPRQLLGWGDVSYVFIREEQEVLAKWIDEMRLNSSPPFQKIATEQFAKVLTRILMKSVEAD